MDFVSLFDPIHLNPHISFYLQLLVLLGTSTFLILVVDRLRLSPVLGYMLAGILIGPSCLGLIHDVGALRPVGELGIACLLFVIGLELSWARLRSMRHAVLGLGGMQVLVTAILIGGGIAAYGERPLVAILLGAAFALSSTAIIVQMMAERGEATSRTGRAAFAILLFQDLAAIPLLAVATAGGGDINLGDVSTVLPMLMSVGRSFVIITVLLAIAHAAARPLLRRIAGTRNNDLFTAFTLFVVIGMGVATEVAGLSLSLGAFLAGLLLSGTAYRHKVEADISPFKALLMGLFFMTVGMSLDLDQVQLHFGAIMLAVAALLLIKGAVVFAAKLYFSRRELQTDQQAFRRALRLAFWLAGAGEFALVVIQAMVVSHLIPAATGQFLLAVVVISLIITPILDKIDIYWQRRSLYKTAERTLKKADDAALAAPQAVIAGYGRTGATIMEELTAAGLKVMAFDSNPEIVAKAQARNLPVYFGKVDDINLLQQLSLDAKRVFIVTIDDPAAVTRLVVMLRGEWPRLPILARAYDVDHARTLQTKGANVTVTETMAASIALAEAALVLAEEG